MEQEVPVIVHERETKNTVKEPNREKLIPDQLEELGNTLSEAYATFKESESYETLVKSGETVKEYIKNNPSKALLYSLGAGALFGLLLRKKR